MNEYRHHGSVFGYREEAEDAQLRLGERGVPDS
jgi:hypothetical protein